ncbi:hypothetical protein DPMN_018032 [Dreissena polymorpha]|uniref:Uncharacterized protein n=1 Tax=Dreissena polymorpha TaxID=45954 RepID=A0A9D4S7X4_DREPO|nr:hypothetical protein DPMN_018032 [Dreissena polymorpha]
MVSVSHTDACKRCPSQILAHENDGIIRNDNTSFALTSRCLSSINASFRLTFARVTNSSPIYQELNESADDKEEDDDNDYDDDGVNDDDDSGDSDVNDYDDCDDDWDDDKDDNDDDGYFSTFYTLYYIFLNF